MSIEQQVLSHFHTDARRFDAIYAEHKGVFSRWIDDVWRGVVRRRFDLTLTRLEPLRGKSVLDVGCGSGRYCLAFAERGAARVVMVESDRSALRMLEASRTALGAAQVEIVGGSAQTYLERARERFDVVFLDPPFRQNALPAALGRLEPRLAQGARVYVESDAPRSPGERWAELKRARAGQVSYQLFEWRGDDQGGLPGNV